MPHPRLLPTNGPTRSSARTSARLRSTRLAALVALAIPGLDAMATPQAGTCGAGIENCLIAHPTPGCDDPDCCSQVCGIFPSCCTQEWDDFCVQLADSLCVGYCGASASGSCFKTHENPGCDSSACCDLVCAIDSFCCSEAWDTNCATLATLICPSEGGECGASGTGDCFEVHPNGACNDIECCTAVCAIDATCCEAAWDFLCVLVAEQTCIPDCQLECPLGSTLEIEVCGFFTNDPCIFPTPGAQPQAIACGETVCGRIRHDGPGGEPIDVDVYALTLTDPDGDGLVNLLVEFRSEFVGFAAVVPANDCANLESPAALATSVECVSGFIDVCLPPGAWRIVVAPGAYPSLGGDPISCGTNGLYYVEVSCGQNCGPACNPNAGDCFVPHNEPGCNALECCEAVCAELPACCDAGWDLPCAQAAVGLCGGSPPANDECQHCTTVTEGTWSFTTIGASGEGPELPPGCDEGEGLSFEGDIWFCYTPTCNAVITVETCDLAEFDTRLAVYTGQCPNLQIVACNDDAACLQPNTSRVEFQAVCGTEYRIRLGGFGDAAGVGVMNIECAFGPPCPEPCPADLNGDDVVDGADLGELLSQWGSTGSADLNGDDTVDGADLGSLLAAWGACG